MNYTIFHKCFVHKSALLAVITYIIIEFLLKLHKLHKHKKTLESHLEFKVFLII